VKSHIFQITQLKAEKRGRRKRERI